MPTITFTWDAPVVVPPWAAPTNMAVFVFKDSESWASSGMLPPEMTEWTTGPITQKGTYTAHIHACYNGMPDAQYIVHSIYVDPTPPGGPPVPTNPGGSVNP